MRVACSRGSHREGRSGDHETRAFNPLELASINPMGRSVPTMLSEHPPGVAGSPRELADGRRKLDRDTPCAKGSSLRSRERPLRSLNRPLRSPNSLLRAPDVAFPRRTVTCARRVPTQTRESEPEILRGSTASSMSTYVSEGVRTRMELEHHEKFDATIAEQKEDASGRAKGL